MKIHWLTDRNPEPDNRVTNRHELTWVLVCSGFLFCLLGDKELRIIPRHLLFIPPGIPFEFKLNSARKNKTAMVSINIIHWFHPHFRPDSGISMLYGTQSSLSKLSMADHTYLYFLIRLMNFKWNTRLPKSDFENGIIDFLLIKEFQNFTFFPETCFNISTNKIAVVDRFFHLLLNSFKSEHAVNYYAARLYVTPEVLNKSVKEVCGQSARKLINSFLIQEAKWLLKDYSLTINDISDELGFSSPSIFSKFFKKNTGYSPFTFRNNPQKN